MMNEQVRKGKWLEIKGDLQKFWGKLTDDDLEKTKGDVKAIAGLLQQKYGEAHSTYVEKVEAVMKSFEAKKDATVTNIKESLKN